MRAPGLLLLCGGIGLLLAGLSLAQLPPRGLPALTGQAIVTPPAAVRPAPPPAKPAPPERWPDPFPITRVYRAAESLPLSATRLNAESLTRLGRDEFEAQVQAASRASQAAAPQLLEARYQAEWTPEGLRGTGEWRFQRTGYFRVEPLGVALFDLKAADGQKPLFFRGEPANRVAGNWLQLDRDDQLCKFQWSVRSSPEASRERYELNLPPAPIATLDLDLPVGWLPTVNAPALMAGRQSRTDPAKITWLIRFSQQSRLELSLKSRLASNSLQPLLRIARQTRYTLQPDQIAFSVELTPDQLREEPTSLIVESDQPVNWTDVRMPVTWEWQVETIPDKGRSRIRIQPGSTPLNGSLIVSGYAIAPSGPNWTLPQISLQNAVLNEDQLTVRLDQDLQLLTHNPGDYRLIGVVSDRGTRLTYTGQLLPGTQPRGDRRTPSFRVQLAEPGWDTVEEIRWQPLPDPAELIARWRGRVSRGPMSSFRVQNPVGFQVTSVSTVPADPNLTWSQAGATLNIEPSRSYSLGEEVELRVDYRPTLQMKSARSFRTPTGSAYSFPRLSLLGNGRREGKLEVVLPPDHRWWSQPQGSPSESGSLVFRYVGSMMPGELVLSPLPSNPITIETELVSEGDQLQSLSQIRFPDLGTDELSIFLPTPDTTRWSIQSESGLVKSQMPEGFTSATLFGCTEGWSALGLAAVGQLTPGELWRIQIPRGAPSPLLVTATATGSIDGPIVVPVPLAWYSVVPKLRSAAGYTLPAGGLLGVYPSRQSESLAGANDRLEWAELELRNQLEFDGRVRASFTGRLTRSAGRPWVIRLPSQAQLRLITLGGQLVERYEFDQETRLLRIPLPQIRPPESLGFEIHYSLPSVAQAGGLLRELVSPLPEFDAAPPISNDWQLNPDWRFWPTLELTLQTGDAATRQIVIAARPVMLLSGLGCALVLAWTLGLVLAGRQRRLYLLPPALLAMAALLVLQLGNAGWASTTRPFLAISLLSLILFSLRWRQSSSRSLVASPLVLVGFGLCQAQAPEPVLVYLGSDQTVLAPTSLLKRLEALARPPQPAIVLTQANYAGQLVTGFGQFQATWEITLDSEQPVEWILPLEGVRLQQLTLDGEPLPVAATMGGFQIRLQGKGTRQLRGEFAVLINTSAALSQLEFTAPECPQSRVSMRLAKWVQEPMVPSRVGRQELRPQGDEQELVAELGAVRTVSIRWNAPTSPKTPSVTVRQLAVWDLSEVGTSVDYALQLQIEGGALAQLVVDVPQGLELDRPILRGADGRVLPIKAVSWISIANPRRLQILPVNPIEGIILLSCRAYTTGVQSRQPVLRLLQVPGAIQGDSDLAIRTDGIAIEELPRIPGVIDYSPDSIIRIPRLGTLPELGLEARAADRVLHQVNGATLQARPVLRSLADPTGLESETSWTLGGHHLARGVIRGTVPVELSMLELDCPAVLQLDRVQADDLLSWSRVGDRVQVWFTKPQRTLEISWSGRHANSTTGLRSDEPAVVALPMVRTQGKSDRVTLLVTPWTGWQLQPEELTGWQAEPSTVSPTQLRYLGSRASSWPKFTVTPPAPVRLGKLEEQVEPLGEGLLYTARTQLEWTGKRSSYWELTLTGLSRDAKPELTGPPSVIVQPIESLPGQQSWRVLVAETAQASVGLRWSARMPRDGQTPEMLLNLGLAPTPWSARELTVKWPNTIPINGPEGWRPASVWNGQQSQWSSSGKPGRWQLLAANAPPSPSDPAQRNSPPPVPVPSPTPAFRPIWPILAIIGWSVGLAAWLLLLTACRESWWPERILFAALLGFWALDPDTLLGSAFLTLFFLGLAIRLFMLALWTIRTLTREPEPI